MAARSGLGQGLGNLLGWHRSTISRTSQQIVVRPGRPPTPLTNECEFFPECLYGAKIDLPYALPGPGGALASRFISCFTIPRNTGQNSQSTSFILLVDSGGPTHPPIALPRSRSLQGCCAESPVFSLTSSFLLSFLVSILLGLF